MSVPHPPPRSHCQEKLSKSGHASTDSKIIVLMLMYKFFITEINHANLECQLQKGRGREEPTTADEVEGKKAAPGELWL